MSRPDEMVTLLAVDDEPLNNDLMQRAFRNRQNRRLLIAPSGAAGLEVLKNERVDVILCDYSMPEMSGVEFLEKVRQIAPEVVSIMVTGYPELREVTDAQSRGLVRHIVAKPWRLNDLLETVERALAMRELSNAVSRIKGKTR
jgi:response regulator RpfG family c-di-GMP phosphodiesterase